MKKAMKTKLPLTVKVAAIPPVASLRLCLVALFDQRVEEMGKKLSMTVKAVMATGLLAQALSKKACFFCGKVPPKPAKKGGPAELCGCLVHLRPSAPKPVSYHELIEWKPLVRDLNMKIAAGEMTNDEAAREVIRTYDGRGTILFEDRCSVKGCGKPFEIRAGLVADLLVRKGRYRQSNLCKECAKAIREARQAREAQVAAALAARQAEAAKKAALEAGERQPTPEEVAAAEKAKVAEAVTVAASKAVHPSQRRGKRWPPAVAEVALNATAEAEA